VVVVVAVAVVYHSLLVMRCVISTMPFVFFRTFRVKYCTTDNDNTDPRLLRAVSPLYVYVWHRVAVAAAVVAYNWLRLVGVVRIITITYGWHVRFSHHTQSSSWRESAAAVVVVVVVAAASDGCILQKTTNRFSILGAFLHRHEKSETVKKKSSCCWLLRYIYMVYR
jgi:hypothetical protein